ncbi:MAG TPA: primosomal protein N' [Candidatus Binatia bacterium]|nr:primosomal protein N' [Candidatus Binatia bacterium]
MPGMVEIAPLPPVPRHDLFTYGVPESLRDRVHPGMRVRVPLGRQTRTGVVTGVATAAPPGELRPVLDVLEAVPFVPPELLDLCRWTARYYLASLAEVIATIVPARVPAPSSERGLRLAHALEPAELARLARRAPARARAYEALCTAPGGTISLRAARARGLGAGALRALRAAGLVDVVALEPGREARTPPPPDAPPVLGEAQRRAAAALAAALAADAPASFLLHGVTGSGKTEVFLAAAEAALARGRSVLVLVPEIALTHQIVERVRARFGDRVAVLHSGLAPRERWDEWRRVREGRAPVVVGARSAVFAPLPRLGLVVVDEEHDAAYKQEDGVRYNARDLAVVRARLARGVVVLASATPSAESYQAARDGRHALLELPERPTAHPLPAVEIVDLRGRPRARRGEEMVSDELRAALEANLARGGQTLVFLNRRGYAAYLQCPACGATASCPHCSVTLTWHRGASALVCHHCRHHRRPPARCPDCHAAALTPFGVGTEQIEAALRACYPLAAVDRLDRDAAQRPAVQRRILRDWRAGTTDILVGTQMVSKGHDVPGVTLVAVLFADLSLNVPDFRAAERTLALLVQVAGRAGRGSAPGRVIVQTLRPEHPALAAAAHHDYAGFMRDELERRRALGYPPFGRLIAVRLDGTDGARVEEHAHDLAQTLRRRATALGLSEGAVLGPAPPPLARVRGRHRWQVLLRSAAVPALRALARAARAHEPVLRRAHVRLVIDVDPYSM